MNWERGNVMNNAPQTIYAFCSAKGGTGKTTLAVACAKLLAADGRVPVLIDADVTGTSIADGLRLCAPIVARRADGMIDLKAPPTGYFSRAQTLELRRARAVTSWTTVPPPPTYLNDALTHNCGDWATSEEYEECNVASLLWKHEKDDGVLYVPSSALDRDVGIALGWLYYEEREAWIRRMAWLIEGMRKQIAGLTDVVIDLPTGFYGFTDEMLLLLSYLGASKDLPEGYPQSWNTPEGRWRVRPFVVMSPDRGDLAAGCSYCLRRREEFSALVPLINRSTDIGASTSDACEILGAELASDEFARVVEMGGLRPMFARDGDMSLDFLAKTHLYEQLRLGAGETQ